MKTKLLMLGLCVFFIMTHNALSVEDGPFKTYYDNGQLKKEGTYKNGKLDGSFKTYFDNGELWKEETYKDGKDEGPYKWYYENGQVYEEGTKKNGVREGSFKRRYYKNGVLKEEGIYKDGIQEGSFKTYYDNGQLGRELTYKGGKASGPFKVYSETGRLQAEGVYKSGEETISQEEALKRWEQDTGMTADEHLEALHKFHKQQKEYDKKVNDLVRKHYGNEFQSLEDLMNNGASMSPEFSEEFMALPDSGDTHRNPN